MLRHLFGTLTLATVLIGAAVPSPAQTISDPPSEPGPYVHQATLRSAVGATDDAFGRQVALAGDIALVSGTGLVYVFERDLDGETWQEVEPLRPLVHVEGFGRALAMDRHTAIVGSEGAAHLFRRGPQGRWREMATLVPGDGHPGFGTSVDIAGDLAIVGAPQPLTSVELIAGAAYIFSRHANVRANWQEVARLTSPGTGPETRSFGVGVGISRDAAIVSELFLTLAAANIFVRQASGDWRPVQRNRVGVIGGDVDIRGRTAVFGGGEFDAFARIFGRDVGGGDAWGVEAVYDDACCGTFRSVEVGDDRIILGLTGIGIPGVDILARNQGGPDAWGRIARFPRASAAVSISGDTALIGGVVFVSDLDGDGLRDALDPCERDPLNNVAGGCQRASGSHALLDHLITLDTVTTETRGRRFLITATFHNSSDVAIRNPFFAVTELTGGNLLANADGGPAGLGATLSPDVGDGVLSPGESTRVTFRIRLRTAEPFVFHVALHGDPAP